MKVKVGSHVTVDRKGEAGTGVSVEFDEPGLWPGHYSIATHGKTPEEIVAERDRIEAHHHAKSARLDDLQKLNGQTKVKGAKFAVHCSLVEQGTDVCLILRLTMDDGRRIKADRLYGTVADVPSNAEITAMIEAALANEEAVAAKRSGELDRVRQALGIT